MARKKNIDHQDIISMYMDYVLENEMQPQSVYKFCKENNFEEALFYKHFGSFDALRQSIFSAFFDNTLSLLHKSDEFQSYDARNQLLSFYYTFFEVLTANRSYVIFELSRKKDIPHTMNALRKLRPQFKAFIDQLDIEKLDLKEVIPAKFQSNALSEMAWGQLLLTLKFWLDDTSPSFEKTDVLIEKSVHASFDLLDTSPLKSVMELGKFLFKETVMS